MLIQILLASVLCFGTVITDVNLPPPDPGDFRFASYYQDNIVLQSEPLQAVLWGYGEVDALIYVAINAAENYSTTVREGYGGHGVWNVTFRPQPPGSGATISACQYSRGTIHIYRILNVSFGDIWICGGQSNMLFPVFRMFNASTELEAMSQYPYIRIFTVSQVESHQPLFDLPSIQQDWAVPTAEIVQYFSAVCWLYARHLYDKLKIPIGVISSEWGGSNVEDWSSESALAQCGLGAKVKGNELVTESPLYGEKPNGLVSPSANSIMWNSMIHPLLNMTIRGVIWYQGEGNALYHRDLYNCSFPAMIRDWRGKWFAGTGGETEPTFPFGFAQIGTTESADGSYPLIRWHQSADVGIVPNQKMPNTFMAVTLDLPDPESPYGPVHSRHKEQVGQRLSAAALEHVYKVGGKSEGPFPMSAEHISIREVLLLYPLPNLKILNEQNFEICCLENDCDVSDISPETQKEWISAPIIKHSANYLIIGTSSCKKAVKRIRYVWAATPCGYLQCSVYSEDNFPAPPFVLNVNLGFMPK